MLGEFKTDQLSVEESELPNKIFVENLNHIKRKQLFQILTIH